MINNPVEMDFELRYIYPCEMCHIGHIWELYGNDTSMIERFERRIMMNEGRQEMMAAICPVCGNELLRGRGIGNVSVTCEECGGDIGIQISEAGVFVFEE